MPSRDLSDYLAFLLASAHRQMRQGLSESISQAAGDEEFTEEHWRILHVLADEQGRSMGELAERVLLNGPALTKNIDKLVSRGVVQRAADAADSRKVLVFISDLGLDVVARLAKGVDAHHNSIEEALGPKRTQQLKRLLESLIAESRGG
jgi:MarR family transcriptional regulator, organic hydroperoxide resistance regulator